MNKKEKFEKFLEGLKGNGQDVLIENVKEGFQICYETEIGDGEEYPHANERMNDQHLGEEKEYKIGLSIIKLLGLQVKENGRVDTTIGDKTPLGLTRTIQRIIEEGGMDL